MTRGEKISLAWVFFIGAAAAGSLLFLTDRSQAMNFLNVLEPPSFKHPFGTDSLGRDLFFRVLCGAWVSLGVAASAVVLSTLIGVCLGLASGLFGGRVDKMLMGFTDLMLCFPSFFLILSVITFFGPNIFNVAMILGLTGWMGTARLVRAEALSLKEREFILAARALGAGPARVMFGHLLPNTAGVILVNAVLGISAAILSEAALSFLGIGVQPPTASWGNILSDGKATLGVAWWLTFFPGIFIFLTVLSANVLGEHLRERRHS